MDNEEFLLKWNDFQGNVSSSFHKLRQDNYFTDVTLACEDKQNIETHKIILAASSPVFENILQNNKQHNHPVIYMRGVRGQDLLSLVDFMYRGEVTILQNNLEIFLALAEDLQLKGLSERRKQTKLDLKEEPNIQMKNLEDTNTNNSFKKNLSDDNETFNKTYNSDYETLYQGTLPKDEIEIVNTIPITYNVEDLDKTVDTMIEKIDGCFVCKVCGKPSKFKQNLQGHIESRHITGTSQPCRICGKTFKSRQSLRVHMYTAHK